MSNLVERCPDCGAERGSHAGACPACAGVAGQAPAAPSYAVRSRRGRAEIWWDHLLWMVVLAGFITLVSGLMFTVGGVVFAATVGGGMRMALDIALSGARWGVMVGLGMSLVHLIFALTERRK